MTLSTRLLAVAALAAGLGSVPTAESAPQFPITLVGEDCYTDGYGGVSCYNTTWTVNADGTFSDSYFAGAAGTWTHDPNVGASGGVMLSYDPNLWSYVLTGLIVPGPCLDGNTRNPDMSVNNTWMACVL